VFSITEIATKPFVVVAVVKVVEVVDSVVWLDVVCEDVVEGVVVVLPKNSQPTNKKVKINNNEATKVFLKMGLIFSSFS